VKAITDSKRNTLHYCIVWKGDGNRRANFIRLWALILLEGLDEGIHNVFNNIEMVMCRVFQSLSPETLEKWFGTMPQGLYSGVGLNVLPPLYQGISVPPSIHHEFKLHLEGSRDLEIQAWTEFRRKQWEEEPPLSAAKHRTQPMLRAADYDKAFRRGLDEYAELSGIDRCEDARQQLLQRRTLPSYYRSMPPC
jgi:hypothetical protein